MQPAPKKNQKPSEATKDLRELIVKKNKKLLNFIPEGQSPKVYIDLIKAHIMKPDKYGNERTDEDLLLFLYACKRTGLDPLAKQIHAVFRWDSRIGREAMTIQTGIDGMRLVAQRSGGYAGSDDIEYEPKDENLKYPTKATATVYKLINGIRVPFRATARWGEYVQRDKEGKNNRMWESMPYNQLGKCAEALALRKGFPNELSGIYSEVEMQQAENPIGDLPAPEKSAIKVMHGAPTEGIGTGEAASQSAFIKKKNKAFKENTQKVKPDIESIKNKIREKVGFADKANAGENPGGKRVAEPARNNHDQTK